MNENKFEFGAYDAQVINIKFNFKAGSPLAQARG